MNREAREVREVSPGYGLEAAKPAVPVGYKQTDVGVIPEDWEVFWLNEHFLIYAGGDVPKDSLSPIQSETHPFPIFANAIKNKGLYGFTNQKRSNSDSLTITARGFLGHAEYREEPFFPIVRLLVLEPKGTLEARFATYAINDRVTFSIESTGVPQLTAPQVGKYAIAAPKDLKEQHAIVTALSDVDALLEELDRLIAKKRDIKQATMQQLLTGQTRLPGFEGEWQTIRLGEHLTFIKNGTNARAELTDDGTVRYLHYGDIHASSSSTLSLDALPFLPANKAKNLGRLKAGDLVFADASEDMDGVGKSVEITSMVQEEAVAGLHTIAVRFDKSILSDGFIAYLQFCPDFISPLRRLAAGTKVYATTRSHIEKIVMRLPEVEEQRAISEILNDIDNDIKTLEKRRAKTTGVKQSMMQELLTGRIRL